MTSFLKSQKIRRKGKVIIPNLRIVTTIGTFWCIFHHPAQLAHQDLGPLVSQKVFVGQQQICALQWVPGAIWATVAGHLWPQRNASGGVTIQGEAAHCGSSNHDGIPVVFRIYLFQRERETQICCSIFLYIYCLILICALYEFEPTTLPYQMML